MGEIILKNAIVREKGYLYYIDSNGSVCKALMKRGGKKKIKKDICDSDYINYTEQTS